VVRAIAIASIAITIASLGLAIVMARKQTRIRVGFDVARAVIGVVAIVVMAVVAQVTTPVWAIVTAVGVGLGLGFTQGSTLQVSRQERGLYARRSPIGISLWGSGIIIIQVAGIASRVNAVRLGQTIAWFSVCLGIGLMFGRTGPMRRVIPAAVAVAVLVFLPVVAVLSGPVVAQDGRLSDEDLCVLAPDGRMGAPGADSSFAALEPLTPVDAAIAVCSLVGTYDYTGSSHVIIVYLFASDGEARAVFDAEAAAAAVWWDDWRRDPNGDLWDIDLSNTYNRGTLDEFGLDGVWFTVGGAEDRVLARQGPFVLLGVGDGIGFDLGELGDDGFRRPITLIEEIILPMAEVAGGIDTLIGEGAPPPIDTGVPVIEGTETGADADEPIEPAVAAGQAAAGAVAAAAIGLITWVEAGTAISEAVGRPTPGGPAPSGDGFTGGEPPLLDEHGDPMVVSDGTQVDQDGRPIPPGRVEWVDGDGNVTWIDRSEAEERLIPLREAERAKQERIASIVEEQESDAAAAGRTDALNERAESADRAAAEALADDIEREQNRLRTRERVTDILGDRAREGGWGPIADRLDSGEVLTREELIEIRDALERLTGEQGAQDPSKSGTFAGDLLDEFAQDVAVAQETAAQIAEMQGGPIAGWAVRNPATSARIAAAMATSGASELIFTPMDIWNAMDAAARRAHAEGRDMTMAEAWAAGAWNVGPGMVIGKVGQVGLRAAAPHLGRLARTAEEAFDSALRRMGEALRGGSGAVPARAGREIFEETMAAAARRAATPPRATGVGATSTGARAAEAHGINWVDPRNVDAVTDFKNAPSGTIIPQSRITSDMGIPMDNYRAARRVVQGNPGTALEIRSTAARSPEHLAGGSLPKPPPVKVKTGNDWDVHLGMRPDDHSLVPWRENGWPQPQRGQPPATWRPDLDDAARSADWDANGYPRTENRWQTRQKEWADQRDKINGLLSDGKAKVNDRGLLEMKDSAGNWQTITGDHDLYRIEIKVPPGLTPAQAAAHIERTKANVMAELRLPPFNVQHGAHVDWVPVTEVDKGIDSAIRGGHGAGGGDGLLRVQSDVPATISYTDLD